MKNLLFILLLYGQRVESHENETVNLTLFEGDNISLACPFDSIYYFWEKDTELIYDENKSFKNRYSILQNESNVGHSLEIINLTTNDTGVYRCINNTDLNMYHEFVLIVKCANKTTSPATDKTTKPGTDKTTTPATGKQIPIIAVYVMSCVGCAGLLLLLTFLYSLYKRHQRQLPVKNINLLDIRPTEVSEDPQLNTATTQEVEDIQLAEIYTRVVDTYEETPIPFADEMHTYSNPVELDNHL